ncbi:transposase InsO family protein [Sagittula marina]|uniref:Transposase InsO family protein n=1 Tax=Sagittula marina TaxID=943940 RepID=A0A7W6GUP8_9RHOB|nr:transposase InsO family protein [Sagittula marina]
MSVLKFDPTLIDGGGKIPWQVNRHRFETIQHAMRVIGDWISFYNNRRPHQALAMRTPAEAFTLAA